jgi:hypothetical protein
MDSWCQLTHIQVGDKETELKDFMHGILIENRPGATYQDHVWDRFLMAKLDSGDRVKLFDPGRISTDLKVGESYIFIVAATAFGGLRTCNSTADLKGSSGGVVEVLNWRPPKEWTYECVDEDLFNIEGLLVVDSRLGKMLLYKSELGDRFGPLSVGMCLEWQTSRLDLMAALKIAGDNPAAG